jgi:hypothetical protein
MLTSGGAATGAAHTMKQAAGGVNSLCSILSQSKDTCRDNPDQSG